MDLEGGECSIVCVDVSFYWLRHERGDCLERQLSDWKLRGAPFLHIS